MSIPCEFRFTQFSDDTKYYSCTVKFQQIPKNQELSFIGKHKYGKTAEDVIYVEFDRCTITKVPQGLTKIFPNMKMLWISNSKLKNICKEDLAEYKNLTRFSCRKNEIEFLPGDLFEDTKNLDWISFWNNKLKVIEPNILDGLKKLEFVNFDENPNYNICYTNYPGCDTTLEQIKLELQEKFKKYSKSDDTLAKEINHLKASKVAVDQENLELKQTIGKLQLELEQEKLKNSGQLVNFQTGVTTDLLTFIHNESTKDFKITINNHEFSVHKFLLAARSPTLATLLKNNPEVENLNLVDISVEIFVKILKFLYTDELPGDDGTNFLHLFAAAGKLNIQKLIEHAATKLIAQIDENNVIEVFKLSNKYEHEELRQLAFDKIKNYFANYKFKDEWITRPEIVEKAIEQYKKAEEAIRKLEEEFESADIA